LCSVILFTRHDFNKKRQTPCARLTLRALSFIGSNVSVPYDSAADAAAVRAALAVDNELQPDKVTKTLKVEGVNLVA
jgi:hypothetical protein